MRWRAQFDRYARNRDDAQIAPGNSVFEEFLAAKRANAVTRALGAGRTVAKRVARGIVRRVTNNFRERTRGTIPARLLAFRFKTSPLLQALAPTRRRDWLGPFDRVVKGADLDIPLLELSFLDHPEATLASLARVIKAETGANGIQLHFDDDRCLDIAPYLVLAMVKRDLAPIFKGGRIKRELQQVIEAVRLRQPLNMGRFKLNQWDSYNVHAFPLHQRRAANSSRSETRHLDPQTRERVQDALVDSINDWLGHPELDMELTRDGRGKIKNIAGEMLDNAERHSTPETMDGDWTVAGFMARRNAGQVDEHFQCSVAFVSLGASVADSLDSSPPAVAQAVDRYASAHKNSTESEVLKTVMAIQDGITRVAESALEGRGGTGFQDVFDLVVDLGDTHLDGCGAKVTIVSGNTCLKMHGPHAIGKRAAGDPYAPREIWFNASNNRNLPPDPAFAFRLQQRFPGTLVTMSFVFTPMRIDGEKNG